MRNCHGRDLAGDPGAENPPCNEKDAGLMPGAVTKPEPRARGGV